MNCPAALFFRLPLLALSLVTVGSMQGKDDTGRTRVPYKIWINHDGTNITGLVSPFHQKGQGFSEQVFAASIDELAGKGIDAVAFSPGNGSVPWWQSKTNDHWEWFVQRTGKKPSAVGQYIMGGGDLVRVFVERCRANGLSPIITLRLKDEHDIERLDSEWVSRFYFEHQSWRLDRDPRAVFGKRGLNWIYPGVAEERLAVIREIAENYDIDGIELDFMRFPPFFDLEQSSYSQRRDVMTGFIRRTREILDRTAKPGKSRVLSIRIPNRTKEYRDIGLDLPLLDREGLIDIIQVSPSYVSQVESDVGLVVSLAPKAAVFYEMTHASMRGPSPSWGRFGDDYPIRVTTDEQFYTAANLAYARGATGISLFNFHYTRASVRDGKHSIGGSIGREPPFHVIKGMRDPAWLSEQPQYYWMPYWWKTGYHGRQFQLPQGFVVGDERRFELDLALPKTSISGARLQIRTAGGTPVLSATEPVAYVRGRPLLVWRAWLNGVSLTPTEKKGEPFPEPYGAFLGEKEDYAAWDVPAQALRDGPNSIELELADAPISDEFNIQVIWMDLAVFTETSVQR